MFACIGIGGHLPALKGAMIHAMLAEGQMSGGSHDRESKTNA